MLIAVTRPVSPTLAACELTHLAREPIDVARARLQHEAYERLLGSLGASIVRVPAAPELPDAVFVEDTAIVLDELAVLTRPGAPARRAETAGVASVLSNYRTVRAMSPPATLDGGDVMRVGSILYVGQSARTNAAGIAQLAGFVAPFGYQVVAVPFTGCLHLKSAVTPVADKLLLLNPDWVSAEAFPGFEVVHVAPGEPYAGNALLIQGSLIYPAEFPRTRENLDRRGLRIEPIECSELAKAEGAVTCCSLILED